MLGIRTESPPGQRYYRRPADATPAPQSSRRGTPPARGCTPAAGQASKRKETCAGRDGAETESKRKRKGYQELKQKRKDKHVGNTYRVPPRLTILTLRESAAEIWRDPGAIPRRQAPDRRARGRNAAPPPRFLEKNTARSWMYAPGRSNTKKEGDLRGEG